MTNHGQRLLAVQHAVDVVDNLAHVVVGDAAGPARADAVGAVCENNRDDGNVPLRLHAHVVVIVVLEQVVIHGREKQTSQRTRKRERK